MTDDERRLRRALLRDVLLQAVATGESGGLALDDVIDVVDDVINILRDRLIEEWE